MPVSSQEVSIPRTRIFSGYPAEISNKSLHFSVQSLE
jgi:hypothetical protein